MKLPATLLKMNNQQDAESLLKLHLICSRIDGKISIVEQDHFEAFLSKLYWESNISIEAFISNQTAKIRKAISESRIENVVRETVKEMSNDSCRAIAIALSTAVAELDGQISHNETAIISILKESTKS